LARRGRKKQKIGEDLFKELKSNPEYADWVDSFMVYFGSDNLYNEILAEKIEARDKEY